MVKSFVVKHMLIKKNKPIKYTQAISLIQLMIFSSIVIIISIFGFYNYFNNTVNHKNLLKLKKLQQALYLTRSEAIKERTKVHLCPSLNLQTCSQDWTNDLIIFIENQNNNTNLKVLHHLQLNFTDPTLKFFGNQKTQIITFLPNGLTNNNGNFCISNYCLYINKAGKIYIK
jgi:type IV fimbrial biogenesis protein FimT